MIKRNDSLTLVELIIAITLIGVIILGFYAAITYNTRTFHIQEQASDQHLEILYAQQFIKREVSNAHLISLDGTIVGNVADAIILKPYKTGTNRKIYLNNGVLYYCDDADSCSTASDEVIAGDIEISFFNSKNPGDHDDFKLVSYNMTKELPEHLRARAFVHKRLPVTSSVYAKLGAENTYVKNLNTTELFPGIQYAVDDTGTTPTHWLACMGAVGPYFDGVFEEQPEIDKRDITLLGGYNQTFEERDIDLYPTVIDGRQARMIDIIAGAGTFTIDGFELTNSTGGVGTAAIYSEADNLVVDISNCNFTNNDYDIAIDSEDNIVRIGPSVTIRGNVTISDPTLP